MCLPETEIVWQMTGPVNLVGICLWGSSLWQENRAVHQPVWLLQSLLAGMTLLGSEPNLQVPDLIPSLTSFYSNPKVLCSSVIPRKLDVSLGVAKGQFLRVCLCHSVAACVYK